MSVILDGRKAREALSAALRGRIEKLKTPPSLAIFQVGDFAESAAYIAAKKRFAAEIGIAVKHKKFSADAAEARLVAEIERANGNPAVAGILVQLPLPPAVDRTLVIEAINPAKDVDGLTAENSRRFELGENNAVIPATARGVAELLVYYDIPVAGTRVAILGRSQLVGGPIAVRMRQLGGIVSVCHSRTPNTKEITRASDIVIVAIGKPRFVDATYLRAGQTVVDVGINRVSGGTALSEEVPEYTLVGDVDFAAAKDIVAAITPVPGGVGPMTVLALFENLVDCSAHRGAHR